MDRVILGAVFIVLFAATARAQGVATLSQTELDSLRLIGSTARTADPAASQAFKAAKRAILHRGATGYKLPRDIYDPWKSIELTFDPKRTP